MRRVNDMRAESFLNHSNQIGRYYLIAIYRNYV